MSSVAGGKVYWIVQWLPALKPAQVVAEECGHLIPVRGAKARAVGGEYDVGCGPQRMI